MRTHKPNYIDQKRTLEALEDKEWHSRDSLLFLVDHLTPEYASRKYISQYSKASPGYQIAVDEEYHVQIKYGKLRALSLHLNYLKRKQVLERRGSKQTREYKLDPENFKLTLTKLIVKTVTVPVHADNLPKTIKDYLEDGWQLQKIN